MTDESLIRVLAVIGPQLSKGCTAMTDQSGLIRVLAVLGPQLSKGVHSND